MTGLMTLFHSHIQIAPMAFTATLMTEATTLITGTRRLDMTEIHEEIQLMTVPIRRARTGRTAAMIGVMTLMTVPMMDTRGGRIAETTDQIAWLTLMRGGMIAPITCTMTGMIVLTRFIRIGMSRLRACVKMFAIWSISGATAAATMENICPRRGRTVAAICVRGGRRAAMTRVRAPKIEVTIGVAAATSCPNTCARTGTMTCAMFASRGATTFSAEPRESPRMPAMVPSWEPSAWRAPEIAGDWNASPRVLKAPEMASRSS